MVHDSQGYARWTYIIKITGRCRQNCMRHVQDHRMNLHLTADAHELACNPREVIGKSSSFP